MEDVESAVGPQGPLVVLSSSFYQMFCNCVKNLPIMNSS